MKIAIAGGHGQIALLLARLITDAGHDAVAIIRNPAHVTDVEQQGATALVVDLEQVDDDELALRLRGVDAVVFAAGAGPNSGAERKETVDRDAAVTLADAAERIGIDRYVMVSAMGADAYDPERAVVPARTRPTSSRCTSGRSRRPTRTSGCGTCAGRSSGRGRPARHPAAGTVHVGRTVPRGSIPRADVAALVLHACSTTPRWGVQFEVTSGDTPIPAALHALS